VKKTIVIGLNDMNFSMEGNQIISEGYLAFSSSDKLRTKNMPNLQKGDKLFLKRSKMHTKNTTQPPKLTESLLITKME
jgi:DNA topoisomerase IA